MVPNRRHFHILQNSFKFGQQYLIMMNYVCDISQSEMEKYFKWIIIIIFKEKWINDCP